MILYLLQDQFLMPDWVLDFSEEESNSYLLSDDTEIPIIADPFLLSPDYKSEFLSCIKFLADAENAFFFIVSIWETYFCMFF